MVCFTIDLFDNEVGMNIDETFDAFFEVGQYTLVESRSPVFGRPDQVVVAQED